MFLFHMRYVSPGKGGIPILLPNKKGAACWSGSFFGVNIEPKPNEKYSCAAGVAIAR